MYIGAAYTKGKTRTGLAVAASIVAAVSSAFIATGLVSQEKRWADDRKLLNEIKEIRASSKQIDADIADFRNAAQGGLGRPKPGYEDVEGSPIHNRAVKIEEDEADREERLRAENYTLRMGLDEVDEEHWNRKQEIYTLQMRILEYIGSVSGIPYGPGIK
ncbi:MAG TPA: hypothetical protein DD381_13700 [Lentisphaeria bacterium]|nr:hypothetical protein [Lentisphaeria bacterium]